MKNIAASVRARLLDLSKKLNIDFNRILLLYTHEGILKRISGSKFRDNFILKGGVLFYGEHQHKARPTKDIDFLARDIGNNLESIATIFKEILAVKINDGLIIDAKTMHLEEIVEDADYHGIRLKIEVSLEKAKINVQLDFGFGDVIIPGPVVFHYPTLLDPDEFTITAYSWESVISEKFEAVE